MPMGMLTRSTSRSVRYSTRMDLGPSARRTSVVEMTRAIISSALPAETTVGAAISVPPMMSAQPTLKLPHSAAMLPFADGPHASRAWPEAMPIWPTPTTSTRNAATHEPCCHDVGPVIAATRPHEITPTPQTISIGRTDIHRCVVAPLMAPDRFAVGGDVRAAGSGSEAKATTFFTTTPVAAVPPRTCARYSTADPTPT